MSVISLGTLPTKKSS